MLHARDGIELRVMVKWPITRHRPQQQQQRQQQLCHESVPLTI